MSKYKTIVADPPWHYGRYNGFTNFPGRKSAPKAPKPMPYPTMTVQEICNLPVEALADTDCQLFLWTTNRYLPEAFKVLTAWGFRYSQTLVWAKTPRGTGQGGLFAPTTEFILIGRKGRMPAVKRIDTTWFNWKRSHNAHSKKPDEANELIEKVSHPPRLEMFARRPYKDWDIWGNEVKSTVNIGG